MGLFYDIISKQGHYEVLINGQFYCSTDDVKEAAKEIEEYLKSSTSDEKVEVYA